MIEKQHPRRQDERLAAGGVLSDAKVAFNSALESPEIRFYFFGDLAVKTDIKSGNNAAVDLKVNGLSFFPNAAVLHEYCLF